MPRVVVNVMPKPEILDPQGKAVLQALGRIGVTGASQVRQGKRFELDVDETVTETEIQAVAEKLLANTVIEDFEIVIEERDAEVSAAADSADSAAEAGNAENSRGER
ncbi:phosphoribosylformylglycinamidine synthase subunit PurS [Corynebacterium sp. MSK297]|uniref:phosphoribosylformylglycinamidine synthase subunit PurS n=1 Tax=Corynebacterium sp. MSK297 TaxID=3050221 RepID=UPI00254C33F7|nr:phosphoribosylformylglycinamidine synthase subunit PurS [Corynebacterium sp. MSK297]MDK8845805.1 phosphoribosylformylglycinamidine synthase subunit PurS [Corynebacterium sp. MSK297]